VVALDSEMVPSGAICVNLSGYVSGSLRMWSGIFVAAMNWSSALWVCLVAL
jgi:hypothetical protein